MHMPQLSDNDLLLLNFVIFFPVLALRSFHLRIMLINYLFMVANQGLISY